MIALPWHPAPCRGDGCGEVNTATLEARCTLLRTFSPSGKPYDVPGCGVLTRIDPHTGIRTVDMEQQS